MEYFIKNDIYFQTFAKFSTGCLISNQTLINFPIQIIKL